VDNRNALKFIEIMEKIRAHEGEIDDLKEKKKALEEKLLANFRKAGIDRVTVEGKTIWLRRDVRASAGGNMEGLVSALREEGQDEFIKESVNANTLSAWVREFDPNGDLPPDEIKKKLPPAVAAVISVTETYSLALRKAD
jgi:hypothetical protein